MALQGPWHFAIGGMVQGLLIFSDICFSFSSESWKKSEYTGEAPQVRLQNEQHQQGQTLFFCFCCCCCRSCAGFKQRCCQCHLSCYPFTQPRTNKVCSALLPTHPSCWNVKSHHPEKTLHGCQVSLVLVLDSSTWLADNFTIPMGWFVWQ